MPPQRSGFPCRSLSCEARAHLKCPSTLPETRAASANVARVKPALRRALFCIIYAAFLEKTRLQRNYKISLILLNASLEWTKTQYSSRFFCFSSDNPVKAWFLPDDLGDLLPFGLVKMSEIRPLQEHDLPAVADMFRVILRKNSIPATPSLPSYLKSIFLDAPDFDPDLASKVHVRSDGRVSGFMGVLPLRMELRGEPVRAAICGSFMVEAHEEDPFAGARLLREVLSGPQDLSFSETSNDISTTMWRKMRATVAAPYSLEWLRVMRPASFVLEVGAGRFAPLRFLKPLVSPFDTLGRRSRARQTWSHYVPLAGKADAFTDTEASETEAAAFIPTLLSSFALRPQWTPQQLEAMLLHARTKAVHGERVLRMVRTGSGKPIGLFIYYGDPGRIGRVVQIIAVAGHEATVIDRLLKHADERGMAAMRGRTQPALLEAMLGRKFAFVHASSTVVHSRRPEVIEAVTSGHVFLNGFAGEGWTRLIGDRFD